MEQYSKDFPGKTVNGLLFRHVWFAASNIAQFLALCVAVVFGLFMFIIGLMDIASELGGIYSADMAYRLVATGAMFMSRSGAPDSIIAEYAVGDVIQFVVAVLLVQTMPWVRTLFVCHLRAAGQASGKRSAVLGGIAALDVIVTFGVCGSVSWLGDVLYKPTWLELVQCILAIVIMLLCVVGGMSQWFCGATASKSMNSADFEQAVRANDELPLGWVDYHGRDYAWSFAFSALRCLLVVVGAFMMIYVHGAIAVMAFDVVMWLASFLLLRAECGISNSGLVSLLSWLGLA